MRRRADHAGASCRMQPQHPVSVPAPHAAPRPAPDHRASPPRPAPRDGGTAARLRLGEKAIRSGVSLVPWSRPRVTKGCISRRACRSPTPGRPGRAARGTAPNTAACSSAAATRTSSRPPGRLGRHELPDPAAEGLRRQQPAHEPHLVEAGGQEEAAELDQPAVGQQAASVPVPLRRVVGARQGHTIRMDVTGEVTGDRPERGAHSASTQQRVRQQPRHPAVPVRKWVDPRQAMVRGGDRHQTLGLPETFRGALVEAAEMLGKLRRRRSGRSRAPRPAPGCPGAAHRTGGAARWPGPWEGAWAACRGRSPTAPRCGPPPRSAGRAAFGPRHSQA